MKKIFVFSAAVALFSTLTFSSFANEVSVNTSVYKDTYGLKEAYKTQVSALDVVREESIKINATMTEQIRINSALELELRNQIKLLNSAQIKETLELSNKIKAEIKQLESEKRAYNAQYKASVLEKNMDAAKTAQENAAALEVKIQGKRAELSAISKGTSSAISPSKEKLLSAKRAYISVLKTKVAITLQSAAKLELAAYKDEEWIKYDEAELIQNIQGKTEALKNITKFRSDMNEVDKEILNLRKSIETQIKSALSAL